MDDVRAHRKGNRGADGVVTERPSQLPERGSPMRFTDHAFLAEDGARLKQLLEAARVKVEVLEAALA